MAALRKTPTTTNGGSDDGTVYTAAVDVEVAALWKVSWNWLITVAGTANVITASVDTAVVAAMASYVRPMGFYLTPAYANTSAVTINIDSLGVTSIYDRAGVALTGGEMAAGGLYPLVYDGSRFRAVTVTSGSAASVTSAPGAIIHDRKAANTAGGTFTSGAWRQRTLNASTRNAITGSSLASNQLTLPSGTYYAEWRADAYLVNAHRSRLYNATDASVVEYSLNSYAGSGAPSLGSCYFTITSAKAFEIDHYCQTTSATNGFGIVSNFGVDEIYCELKVWKQ